MENRLVMCTMKVVYTLTSPSNNFVTRGPVKFVEHICKIKTNIYQAVESITLSIAWSTIPHTFNMVIKASALHIVEAENSLLYCSHI